MLYQGVFLSYGSNIVLPVSDFCFCNLHAGRVVAYDQNLVQKDIQLGYQFLCRDSPRRGFLSHVA